MPQLEIAGPSGDRGSASAVVDAPDAVLVAGCRDGDDAAWNALVDRYQDFVYSIARAEGLDVEDAADVAQHTFSALLAQLTTIRQPDRLRWWLGSVARRRAWRVRHRVVKPAVGPDQAEVSIVDATDEWVSAIAVHEALARLGEPCRRLLTLLYLDPAEPSYEDVAARLGRSPNGIGPARARCLAAIREVLEARLDD